MRTLLLWAPLPEPIVFLALQKHTIQREIKKQEFQKPIWLNKGEDIGIIDTEAKWKRPDLPDKKPQRKTKLKKYLI